MNYKRMTLILLMVGGLYLFSGLDSKADKALATSSSAVETESLSNKLPLFIPSDNPAQQKMLYGALLLAAAGVFFISSKRKEVSAKK